MKRNKRKVEVHFTKHQEEFEETDQILA